MVHTKVNKWLNEISQREFVHPCSTNPQVGDMIYSITRNLNPKTVVEIGAFIGYSTICLAQAMKDNGQDEGCVYSIDPFVFLKKASWLSKDIDNAYELAIENIREAGVESRVESIKGYSHDVAYNLLPKLDEIDLLFIDGKHTYKAVLSDYNLYHSKVRKGGLILFHDINPKECGWWGPRLIIDSLKRSIIGKKYEIFEMDTIDGFGLAICKKKFNGSKPLWDNFFLENMRKFLSHKLQGESFLNVIKIIKKTFIK